MRLPWKEVLKKLGMIGGVGTVAGVGLSEPEEAEAIPRKMLIEAYRRLFFPEGGRFAAVGRPTFVELAEQFPKSMRPNFGVGQTLEARDMQKFLRELLNLKAPELSKVNLGPQPYPGRLRISPRQQPSSMMYKSTSGYPGAANVSTEVWPAAHEGGHEYARMIGEPAQGVTPGVHSLIPSVPKRTEALLQSQVRPEVVIKYLDEAIPPDNIATNSWWMAIKNSISQDPDMLREAQADAWAWVILRAPKRTGEPGLTVEEARKLWSPKSLITYSIEYVENNPHSPIAVWMLNNLGERGMFNSLLKRGMTPLGAQDLIKQTKYGITKIPPRERQALIDPDIYGVQGNLASKARKAAGEARRATLATGAAGGVALAAQQEQPTPIEELERIRDGTQEAPTSVEDLQRIAQETPQAPVEEPTSVEELQAITQEPAEITAKVQEPSEELLRQVGEALAEQGYFPEEKGEKKPEERYISRMRGPGEQWKDIFTRTFGVGAKPATERLGGAWDLLWGAFAPGENISRTVLPMPGLLRPEQPMPVEAKWLLAPKEGRPTMGPGPGAGAAELIADIASYTPTMKGAKALTKLAAKGAETARAAKEARRFYELPKGKRFRPQAVPHEPSELEKQLGVQSRMIPGGIYPEPAPQKVGKGMLKVTRAAEKAKEQLGPQFSVIPSRVFRKVVKHRPRGVEGDSEYDAALAAVRWKAYNAPIKATKEDLEEISKLATTSGEDTMAKRAAKIGVYLRSSDNWLEDHGGLSVVEPIRRAVVAGDEWANAWKIKLDGLLGGIKEGSKEAEAIGAYLNGRVTKELTPELRDVAKRMHKEFFESLISQVRNDKELARIIGPVGYINDYFPQLEKAWSSRYGEENALALVHDLAAGKFKARIFKQRVRETENPILDIRTVSRIYLQGTRKTLFDVKGYAQAVDALKALPAGPEDLIRDVGSKYAKTFIGQPSTRHDVKALHRMLNKVHDYYYKAYIGFNPVSAGLNLTQTANTYVEVGGKHTLRAIKDALKSTPEMEAKFIRTGLLAELPGMEVSESLAKYRGKIDDALFFMFKRAEAMNRKIAFYAGYYEASAKNVGHFGPGTPHDLVEAARVRHALDVVHRTQFTYGKTSPVPWAQRPLLGQFSNYPLKQAEFLIRAVKDPAKRKRLATLVIMTGLADYAATGSSLGLSVAEYLTDLFPGVGPAVKDLATVTGLARKGGMPPAYEVGRRIPFVGGVLRTGRFLQNIGENLVNPPKKKK